MEENFFTVESLIDYLENIKEEYGNLPVYSLVLGEDIINNPEKHDTQGGAILDIKGVNVGEIMVPDEETEQAVLIYSVGKYE